MSKVCVMAQGRVIDPKEDRSGVLVQVSITDRFEWMGKIPLLLTFRGGDTGTTWWSKDIPPPKEGERWNYRLWTDKGGCIRVRLTGRDNNQQTK